MKGILRAIISFQEWLTKCWRHFQCSGPQIFTACMEWGSSVCAGLY